MFTYIKIIDTFKDIADGHRQINTFGFGDTWETATSGVINYPMLWVVPDGGVYSRGEVGNRFKVIVMDYVQHGEVNENDVLNDTQLILLDVLAELANQTRASLYFRPSNIPLQNFTERFDDEVSGWSADIILWTDYDADRCAIPSTLTNKSTL